MTARVYALELLITQLTPEYLRTVPDAPAQAKWARGHRQGTAEALGTEPDSADNEARLRAGIFSAADAACVRCAGVRAG